LELTGKTGVDQRTAGRVSRSVAALLTLAVFTLGSAQAGPVVRFAGAVSGLVIDSVGKPQPGASVSLFNRQARLLQKSYTDLSGNFSFGDLLPDLYSVQVSLASFVPASREQVPVRPGMRSLLEVSLSRIFSSIQVVSTVPAPGGLMSDDWKWTLRADSSVRPVIRLLPSSSTQSSTLSVTPKTGVFHDSSALVRISATDTAITSASADEADLGTQFAFATSLYSHNRVRVSGDLGFASATGQPGAAIRTTFTREIAGESPTVSFTMREISVPAHVGQGIPGGPSGESALPTLRTLSVSTRDKAQFGDSLTLVYGSDLDTISYLNHLQYFSPWAKLSYALPRGHLDMVFTSGNARRDLDFAGTDNGLQGELTALATMPRLSELAGQLKAQRGDDYEIGYSEIIGAMEYRVSGYHQYVSNATLNIANPDVSLFNGDLLPSMFSASALFDAGTISSSGYTVSATRSLTPHQKLTVAYGSIGVMTPNPNGKRILDAQDLRQGLATSTRGALTVLSAGTFKGSGTHYVASYQYADLKSAVPMASFSTQPDRVEPGLNIAIRQPIPFFFGIAGHVEATAEVRNLLAQGYLPVSMADGSQLLIVNNPRVFRGGLAFTF
jgi:hypothetical protein